MGRTHSEPSIPYISCYRYVWAKKRKNISNGDKKIQLLYYWPADFNKDDAILNFQNTPKMLKFFEEYIEIKYPYNKYAQVAVEDFEFGGMENTSCTTLTRDILFDKKASLDYTSDDVISHELAHQWFGDLVTCRDWPHIWLNEGFATYFEALYWEVSRSKDEFQYYMVQMADSYLNEASSLYKRAIVTKMYKNIQMNFLTRIHTRREDAFYICSEIILV